jgi:SAM-dependent methyltransferase
MTETASNRDAGSRAAASREAQAQMEANRAMWNETAAVHERASLEKLSVQVAAPDFSTFDAVERELFARIGLKGKDVAQLACNNGRELLSCQRAGAARGVGFDISDAFIRQARQLAAAAGLNAEFVRSSLYDIPHDYDASFDLVYVTIGALGWLPDLPAFWQVVRRLLRPGGQVFLYEMHPILFMFEAEHGLTVRRDYFDTDPDVVAEAPDYLDPSQVVAAPSYWYQHTLGDVLGGCLDAGFALEHFREYPHDISATYASFERLDKKPPLCYTLLARKP